MSEAILVSIAHAGWRRHTYIFPWTTRYELNCSVRVADVARPFRAYFRPYRLAVRYSSAAWPTASPNVCVGLIPMFRPIDPRKTERTLSNVEVEPRHRARIDTAKRV